jgi:hypothetical protein
VTQKAGASRLFVFVWRRRVSSCCNRP